MKQFLPAFLLVCCMYFVGPQVRLSAAERKPLNVLFIAVDDLNDWIQCLGGHPDTKSPHLDALAGRGVLFERAYCAAPACNPSRAALMTGIRPSSSGVYLNAQPWRPAMPEIVTLPQHFMRHGYRAVGGGKIYHGGFDDDASWHEYFRKGSDPLPATRPVNGIPRTAHFDWGPVPVRDEQMNDHRVVDWAIGELRKSHDKPFFLACGIFRPHLPWYVPQKYFDMFPLDSITLPKVRGDDLADVPAAGKKMAKPDGDHRKVTQTNNWRRAVQGYLASIAFADAQVGRLIAALDASDYADNTVVILWGDHGWHLGEKQHWRKFSLWEEADRAPLMIYVPGMTRSQGRCLRTVSFVDIYPTLADVCGLPTPKHLEGRSLKSLLQNPQAEWSYPAITTHGKDNHAVRSERFRYIRYADGSEELYDHAKDPMEWTNLADDQTHRQTKVELAKWLPQKNAPNAAMKKKPKQKQPKP